MRTDPPAGDELTSMLTTMKTNVLRRADETMNQPTPARRTRRRVIGITIAIISLLIVGSAGTALATGLLPSPFVAPQNPVITSTPSPIFTSTSPPTALTTSSPTTPTENIDDPSDPSTWVIGFDHVGPVYLGMSPAEVTTLVPTLAPPEPNLGCTWRSFGATYPLRSIVWLGPQGSEADPVSLLIVNQSSSSVGATPRTDRGIGSGSTPAEVTSAYPEVVTPENFRGNIIMSATDNSSGDVLQFWIDPNTNAVSSIYVIAAGFDSGGFACD